MVTPPRIIGFFRKRHSLMRGDDVGDDGACIVNKL